MILQVASVGKHVSATHRYAWPQATGTSNAPLLQRTFQGRFDISALCSYACQVKKKRLDMLLLHRGLAESRKQAQSLILAGQVMVNGAIGDKAGRLVSEAATVELRGRLPYVSRGGYKLAAALDAFDLDVAGWVAADVGASTGGFTDCLLQRGAVKVYAIDVGYGQLAWKLRQDPRVVVLERTNVRYLGVLPEEVNLATVDVSFIGLELVLPVIQRLLAAGGQIVALVKPQFEAGRRQVGKGGVVRDPVIHREVLSRVIGWAGGHGLWAMGLIPSPITGPKGNVEFLLHLAEASAVGGTVSTETLIDVALATAPQRASGVVEAAGV